MDFVTTLLERIENALETLVVGVPVWRFVLAALIITVALIARRLIATLLSKLMSNFAAKTDTNLDDYILEAAYRPMQWAIVVIGTEIAVLTFPWLTIAGSEEAHVALEKSFMNIFALFYIWIGAFFLWQLVEKLGLLFLEKRTEEEKKTNISIVVVTMRKFLRILIIVIAAAMTLERLGQDIKMILASFTVISAALAFAGRDAIANVFAAIVLSVDRPFSIGDWVVVGGTEGTIEELGMRSTKIRTFAKSLVHIPNNQLMNMTIENMSARPMQRVRANFGITYDSDPEKVEQLVAGIRKIIESNPRTYKDYIQVWFTELASDNLSIMLYFFIESKVWAEFLEERQRIYIDIMKLVKRMDLEFAFPTQTIFLHEDQKELPK